jgi:hypothetical protein
LPSPAQQRLLVFPLNVAAAPTASAFPTSDAFSDGMIASTPPWTPRRPIVGACMDESGTTWFLVVAPGGLTLYGYRSNGSVFSSRAIEWSRFVAGLMAARNHHVFVAAGDALLRVPPTGDMRFETIGGVARQLATSAPFTRTRLAIAHDEGGTVFWDDGQSRPFGEGLFEPAVGFTRGGALVALSKGIGRAYRTEDQQVRHHATFTGPERPPLAVVATDRLHHFATFGDDGAVRVFQLTG